MFTWFRLIPRHIKTAFKSVFRHAALTFSSSSAVMVTLTLLMAFLMLAGNVANFTYNIEDSLKIHATIKDTIVGEDIDQLREELLEIPHVKEITFSSKDKELDNYIGNMNESSRELYEIYKGEANPLLNAFIVEVDSASYLEFVNEQILEREEIKEANYGGSSAGMMIKTMDGIRTTGLLFVVALSILAIFLISNTIKSAIYSRNTEIAIMRNVGASNGFIRLPFMIEGMIIGVIGSIVPILIAIFGYEYLYESMNGMFLISMFQMQPINPFSYQVSLILLCTGVLVGWFGSALAVGKYLRWKR